MIGWGLAIVLTVTARNYGSVLTTRIFAGAFEAFIQGTVFYLSF